MYNPYQWGYFFIGPSEKEGEGVNSNCSNRTKVEWFIIVEVKRQDKKSKNQRTQNEPGSVNLTH